SFWKMQPNKNTSKLRAKFRLAMFVVLFSPSLSFAQSAQEAMPSMRPDFGSNVLVFEPSMPAPEIQAQIDKVYAIQQHSEFGSARYALLFLPGEYHVDIPVGFYT